MARREGPVHVATTRRVYKGKVYETTLLRRTYRDGDKVKHETVGNLSHLPPEVIENVRAALRGDVLVSAHRDLEIRRSLPHGHVAAVLGTLRRIGLDGIIASEPSAERALAVAMVAARIIEPRSKLATARELNAETFSSSLGQVLGIEAVSEDNLYEAMDWLLERQVRIENKLAKRHLTDGSLVLYDVTSSYYTGTCCPLAEYGHNRDGKKAFPQIVYGLLCNGEGCPIAVEVFEGNTGDPATLGSQINKIRRRFALNRVILVGDRGMITAKRIDEELRNIEGLDWITALRAPAIARLAEQGAIQMSFFDQCDLAEITSPDFPGERLILCRNPLLAEERTRKREDLLRATERELEKIAAATRREKRRLRRKENIARRLGRIENRFKMAKHFIFEISDEAFSYRRDTEKIAQEAALDGLYVIRTSVTKERLTSEQTVGAYKGLSRVERAFRCLKTVDLKVRPIHHHLENRVRAHVFLCMLAYYVEYRMRRALAPILFDDDDPEEAQASRTSIVAPAQRSASAKRKAVTKRTEEDLPVHSFQTLLKDLATITKNQVRAGASEFSLTATPTQEQRRALELLGVSLNL
jgi:transposase